MSGKQKTILLVLGLVILCTLVAAGFIVTYYILQSRPTQQEPAQLDYTSVQIISPLSREQLMVGRPVMVHSVASSSSRITRIELWIDGHLQSAQNSSQPRGVSPFPLVIYWQPAVEGTHTLIARAFNAQGEQAQTVVAVEATEESDRDADGVADDFDSCPDQPGIPSAAGCPDSDGDSVPDGEDVCPDEPGAGPDGCPAPSEGDRDGDGIPDTEDACPDEPGIPMDGCPLIGDRDGDGVTDLEDFCPDEPGSPETDGCRDRDGDGIPDTEDACPDEPGPFDDGCVSPSDGDRDGDGFPDSEDMCPDVPGVPETLGCPDRDRDGVRDGEDECPDQPGLPEEHGCPVSEAGGPSGGSGDGGDDSDDDGTPDTLDPCPFEPGPPEHDGCPDTDGDGIPDWWDRCPDEPGTPEAVGCPGTGVGDRDGDGAPDDVDLCPDEAGRPEDGGCPPPTEGEEGIAPGSSEDEWPGEIPVVVEFQALSFQVSHDYDGAYCYPSLAGGSVERYAFEPLGERQWDIVADLGSRSLLTNPDQPIDVQVECGADNIYLGDGEGWGTYWRIGSISESHPSTDWDGHVITVRSTGGDEGRWFEAQYRLCANSCDETDFPIPLLLLSHGRDDLLIWQWNGDLSRLQSYQIYMDGNRIMNMRGTESVASMSVNEYAPSCGSRHSFYVVAVGNDDRESPPSNMVIWEAESCPRVVRVTFDRLLTYDTSDQEHNCLGPIFGSFWVQGSESQSLAFEGDDYPDGFRLCPHRRYNIQEMFDTIWRWGSGMGSSPYWAPASSSVSVELGPNDDFSLGGVIFEWDRQGTQPIYREVFNHFRAPVPSSAVRPGRYALQQGQIRLEFVIDVLVGPDAGPEPDLTITNVDKFEDQLRVHVFNNASDMPEPVDITVQWVHVGSSEVMGTETWHDVQIPSGGRRILQTSETVGDIGGMLFVLDPDGAIPDGNRGNNTFETPIMMRVEFLQVRGAHCSETGCSIFDCDSEWEFKFWAGFGPSESDISWIAHHVRFPPVGDLVACDSRACEGHESSDSDWIMEGDLRYTFEFEMSATQNLYVMVTGTELDVWTSDDPFSTPIYEYYPRDNWGARTDPYQNSLEAESSCGDAFCQECHHPSEVWARWRITRVEY